MPERADRKQWQTELDGKRGRSEAVGKGKRKGKGRGKGKGRKGPGNA